MKTLYAIVYPDREHGGWIIYNRIASDDKIFMQSRLDYVKKTWPQVLWTMVHWQVPNDFH
jgi:hypothetical protein